MKLIDKDALVAEIERRTKEHHSGYLVCLKDILSFINTLEVKEVDLEEEMDKEWNKCEPTDEGMGLEIASIEHEQFDNIVKHFFELGMTVSNKAQKGEYV